MKNLTSALIIVVILSAASFGQPNNISPTLRNTFSPGSLWNPQVIVYATHTFKNSSWSFVDYDFVGKIWSEAFFGLQYSPSSSFYATVYAGAETKSWWRLAGEANVRWKKLSWYNYYEGGITPGCWISMLSLSLAESFKGRIKAYAMSNNVRIGPGFSWSVAKTPLVITPIALYNSTSRQVSLQLDLCSNF